MNNKILAHLPSFIFLSSYPIAVLRLFHEDFSLCYLPRLRLMQRSYRGVIVWCFREMKVTARGFKFKVNEQEQWPVSRCIYSIRTALTVRFEVGSNVLSIFCYVRLIERSDTQKKSTIVKTVLKRLLILMKLFFDYLTFRITTSWDISFIIRLRGSSINCHLTTLRGTEAHNQSNSDEIAYFVNFVLLFALLLNIPSQSQNFPSVFIHLFSF